MLQYIFLCIFGKFQLQNKWKYLEISQFSVQVRICSFGKNVGNSLVPHFGDLYWKGGVSIFNSLFSTEENVTFVLWHLEPQNTTIYICTVLFFSVSQCFGTKRTILHLNVEDNIKFLFLAISLVITLMFLFFKVIFLVITLFFSIFGNFFSYNLILFILKIYP